MGKSTTTEVELATIYQLAPPSVSLNNVTINQRMIIGQPTKTMELGITEVPEEMFMEMLQDVRDQFTPEKYHVFTNNCNNFTNVVSELLLGSGIPDEIINLPQEFLNTPLGRQMSPMMMQMQDSLKLNSNQLFN